MRTGLGLSVICCWLMATGVSSFLIGCHPSANVLRTPQQQYVSSDIRPSKRTSSSSLAMMDVSSLSETTNAVSLVATAIDSSGFLVAETEAWVQPTAFVLGPFLNFMSFTMLCRVVASWYPETNLKEFPWVIIAWPSEPLLRLVKGAIPPAFGVDITPVFWLAIFTFFNEILLGQQGLLVMKIKYGI